MHLAAKTRLRHRCHALKFPSMLTALASETVCACIRCGNAMRRARTTALISRNANTLPSLSAPHQCEVMMPDECIAGLGLFGCFHSLLPRLGPGGVVITPATNQTAAAGGGGGGGGGAGPVLAPAGSSGGGVSRLPSAGSGGAGGPAAPRPVGSGSGDGGGGGGGGGNGTLAAVLGGVIGGGCGRRGVVWRGEWRGDWCATEPWLWCRCWWMRRSNPRQQITSCACCICTC